MNARTFAPELIGKVDPALLSAINRLFEAVYKLQETQSKSVTPTAVKQQLVDLGLLNILGQPVLGLTGGSDPQLSSLPVSPGTGTVQSIAAASSATGFGLVATPAPIVGTGTITLSVTNAAQARATLGVTKNNSAAVAPTVNDDSSLGYAINSLWTDTTGPTSYICQSAAVGAAVWHAIP